MRSHVRPVNSYDVASSADRASHRRYRAAHARRLRQGSSRSSRDSAHAVVTLGGLSRTSHSTTASATTRQIARSAVSSATCGTLATALLNSFKRLVTTESTRVAACFLAKADRSELGTDAALQAAPSSLS